jgi:hypothetical protein
MTKARTLADITIPSGTPVGTTDTQTLTNKTLTAPTIASANLTTALTVAGASGSSGQVLTSGGSGNAPTWASAASSSYRSILNQSSNITLLSTDGGGFINVSGTTDLNLNLPAANALTNRTIYIKNVGNFAMFVFDGAGTYLFPLNPNSAIALWASDNSTVAGQWTVQENPTDYASATAQLAIYGVAAGVTKNATAKISSTDQIYAYYRQIDGTGSKPYALIVTQASGVLTFGTPYLIADEGGTEVTVTMTSATTGVVTWFSSSEWRGCVITVSGTTITAGTPITIYTGAPYGYSKTESASSTTVVATFAQSQTVIQGCVLTISGTTLSAGTLVRLNTGRDAAGYDYFLGVGSSTFGNICFTTSGSELFGTGFTISGSTITAGTPTQLNGGTTIGQVPVYGCTLSASKIAIMYYDSVTANNMMIRCVNWSGTTPTSASAQQAIATNNNAYTFQVGAMTGTSGVITYNKGGGISYLRGWTLSTNTFTFGTEVAGASGITATYQYNNLVGFASPSVGTPTSATYMSHYQYQNGSNMQTLTLSGTTVSQTSTRNVVASSTQAQYVNSPKSVCALSTTRAITLIGSIGDGPSTFNFSAVLLDCTTTTPTILQTLAVGISKTPMLYSIAALSSTQAIVTFTSSTGTQEAQVITMSGSTISLGTQLQISSSTTCIATSVARLSATTAICAWRDSSSINKAVVLTVSGSTITAGTVNTFLSTALVEPFVEGLSATKAIISYSSGTNRANIFNISGTTITVGPQQTITMRESDYGYLSALSSTKCVYATGSGAGGANSCIAVLTISGDSVSVGTETVNGATFLGYKVACTSSKSGIVANPYTSFTRSFVIVNNAVVFSPPQPANCVALAALTAPHTATPSASRFIIEGDTGYQLLTGTIYTYSGAIN